MYELVPDRPDFYEYEAKLARVRRLNRRMRLEFERAEQEREDEFISNR